MEYKEGGLDIKMHANVYAQGNGSCSARISYKGKLVYDASGSYTAGPWGVKEHTHKKGAWEKLVGKVRLPARMTIHPRTS